MTGRDVAQAWLSELAARDDATRITPSALEQLTDAIDAALNQLRAAYLREADYLASSEDRGGWPHGRRRAQVEAYQFAADLIRHAEEFDAQIRQQKEPA